MKRAMTPTTLVTVFATAFALSILPKAQAGEHIECSTASLQGSFGFTSTGTLLALPPLRPALSLKSVGRPSTGKVTLTQPRR